MIFIPRGKHNEVFPSLPQTFHSSPLPNWKLHVAAASSRGWGLLREKDFSIHSWAAIGSFIHEQLLIWGLPMNEQLLMCREKSHERLLIYRGAHARAATHVQKNTVMSSCSYKDTQAWAATNVQKKWHSWTADHRGGGFHAWAATHVQRKHDIHEQLLIYIFIYIYRGTHAWAATHVQKNKWHSRAAAHIGVPMHEQLLMCRKNDTHEQLLMWKKKWHSWATAQKKGYSCTWAAAHVQEKNGHEQLAHVGVLAHEQLAHEQLLMSAKWILSCMSKI